MPSLAAERRGGGGEGEKQTLPQLAPKQKKQQSVEILPLETMEDNLESNDKLYDRDRQARDLVKAYQRRTRDKPKCAEFVLLNGGSGSGKTSLAKAFGKQVVAGGLGRSAGPGMFLSGKCQLRTTAAAEVVPYDSVAQAMEQFVEHVLNEPKEVRDSLREVVEVVVGSELCLLLEILPCLRRLHTTTTGSDCVLMDKSETSEESSSSFAVTKKGAGIRKHKQFAMTLRRFFRAVCSGGKRNLVIFLDDLQWSDETTLELISVLVSPSIDNNQGLMVLGSCRGGEMSAHDPLSVLLRNLESNGTRITEIMVPNLGIGALTSLIGDTTSLSLQKCQSIANLTFQQTSGNPFYIRQYLQSLEGAHALYVDANDGVWVWNEVFAEEARERRANKVFTFAKCDNQSCLVERMKELPLDIQEVLMASAYLGGGDVREIFLCWALTDGTDKDERELRQNQVRKALCVGVAHPFWEYNFHEGVGKFRHDKFQEAALLLVPKDQQASFQLRLGRNLQTNARDIPGLPKALPTFVNLILSGKTEISCQAERNELASLCLEGGRLMAKSSAFASAMEHVVNGINLLSVTHWTDQYQLSLRLYNAAAELAYCNGDHARVDEFVCEVRDNVRDFEDGLQADTTQILSLASRGLNDRAGTLGIHALRRLGEPVPRKITRVTSMIEVYRARRHLRGKTDEDILGLPRIRNRRALKVMSILHVLYPIAVMSHMEYTATIACRLICLTLQHGLCSYSSVGFAFYGSCLARTGRVLEGCRYGELSLKIMEKHPTKELMARALQRVGLNLRTYKEPFHVSIATLMEAERLGMMTGDIETGMYAATSSCGIRFYTGEPLQSIVDATRHYVEQCVEYGQHATSVLVRPLLQCGLNLLGEAADNPLVLTGEAMDERELMTLARAEHNTGIVSFILFTKYVIATYMEEFEYAESISSQLRRLVNRKHPPFVPMMWTFHLFFEGLVSIALAKRSKNPSLARNRYLRIANRRLKTIREAAVHCCENMMNKAHLLEADLAALHGRHDEAEFKYRQSTVYAQHGGFLPEQALACQKMARTLLERKCIASAESYLAQARSLYERYGAVILVERITREMEALSANCEREVPPRIRRSSLARSHFSPGCLLPKITERDLEVSCR